jgi:glucokinase
VILAGDIGGTKTELGLYDGAVEVERARFASHDYPGLANVAREFLHGRRVQAAAFAVAGPVAGGRSKTTNLPWEIDERALAAEFGAKVGLLNDLAAALLGIDALEPAELVWLAQREREQGGVIAAIGAGTGLGEAIAVPSAQGLTLVASEGGHADFTPHDEREIELLRFLKQRHGDHVSLERALSGAGLVAIYEFVVARGLAASSEETRALMRADDPAAVVGRCGAQGSDAACAQALSIFVSLYGAEAGNLALKVVPRGGLFLVGGIAPKLIERLRQGDFMRSMLNKGRMSELMASIPVAVVMNPHVTLLGARAHANMLYRTG